MEIQDHEQILEMSNTNPNLRKLYSEHVKLERKIKNLEAYQAYSPTASLKAKELKKMKLMGVDTMMGILKSQS